MNYEKNFKTALKFAAKSELRPVLQGVYHREDGKLIATDSHRLIIINNGHDGRNAGDIIAKDGRVIPGNYPDVNRIIPQNEGSKILIDINKWIELLSKIKKENKEATQVYMKLTDEPEIIFQSIIDNLIENEYKMEYNSTCELDICYNINYMLDSLKALKSLSYKECTMTIKKSDFPILITVKDDNVLILNMPIRLKVRPRIKTEADIKAIINEGDIIEFKHNSGEMITTKVTKVNRKYFHILMDGKECKVAKENCKKVS